MPFEIGRNGSHSRAGPVRDRTALAELEASDLDDIVQADGGRRVEDGGQRDAGGGELGDVGQRDRQPLVAVGREGRPFVGTDGARDGADGRPGGEVRPGLVGRAGEGIDDDGAPVSGRRGRKPTGHRSVSGRHRPRRRGKPRARGGGRC